MSEFSTDLLLRVLGCFPVPRRYCIAFSGGLDSSVLLHAMTRIRERLPAPIRAIHVDHGLSPDSSRWAAFCAEVCESLQVSMDLIEIDARHPRGASPEDWARRLRYRALLGALGEAEMLLTAHHEDDQAETLMLQLLRGAGPAGLAAMPAVTSRGSGWMARPLLSFGREALQAYAHAAGIRWITDPSNAMTHHDRNLLRRDVVPLLKRRWPAIATTLRRAAEWQAEAAALLSELAALDLAGMSNGPAVSVTGLKRLPEPRRRNALRLWLKRLGLPTPTTARLRILAGEVLAAGPDRAPLLRWPGAELRRYRDRLYAWVPGPSPEPEAIQPWDLRAPLVLPHGELRADATPGRGIRPVPLYAGVTVRFRQGGERLRPQGHAHTRPLKHLFQEAAIPPWIRGQTPLIYLGDELVAVAGFWIAHGHAAEPGEEGLSFVFRPRSQSL